ncbi:MAG: DMT family transporter [Rubrobacteraceae bacterium]
MKGRDLGLLLALGAMWGSSFLFIKVSVAEVSPVFVVACRLMFAVLTLLVALSIAARGSGKEKEEASLIRQVIGLWRPFLVLGVSNAVMPYLAIAWGTQFLPSGTAAILNSTVPLFTAVMVGVLPWFGDERLGLLGVAGILLGMLGVGVLAGGFGGLTGDFRTMVLGAGAILCGSAGYAVGGLYAKRTMKGVPVRVSAVGQNVAGFVVILPFAAFFLPEKVPSPPVVGSLIGLGAVGTGLSLLLYFRLIANVGATRTAIVTYLVPIWALAYGALLLGEGISASDILGMVLILTGVAGVSGIARLPRKQPPEGTPDDRAS